MCPTLDADDLVVARLHLAGSRAPERAVGAAVT